MNTNTIVSHKKLYCSYYRAHVERSQVWILVSALRGTEYVSFDRTFDVEQSIFEFFVPREMEQVFLEVIDYLQKKLVIKKIEKLPNRLSE